MMTFVLKMLAGPAGLWILLGTLLGVLAFGATTATVATVAIMRGNVAVAEKATSDCNAARQKDRADASEKSNTALVASINTALEANAAVHSKDADRVAKAATLLERLSHVPSTKACLDSPAVHAYLGVPNKTAP
jgi:hypothetical protein